MAVSHHMKPGLGQRTRVKIITVDTVNRIVQAAMKDGSPVHIAVWDVPTAFRWPQENEEWIVRQDSGYWMLDRRVQKVKAEAAPITTLNPGEVKIDGDVIKDAQGRVFITVDITNVAEGDVPRWDSSIGGFVAGPLLP